MKRNRYTHIPNDKRTGRSKQVSRRRFSSIPLSIFPLLRDLRCFPLYILAFMLVSISSCSSIDCPMNSLVYTQYQLRTSDGLVDTLHDTLTISTQRAIDGNDSILINRNVRTTEFSLPISYAHPQDVFFFEMIDTLTKATTYDTVTVTKEDHEHFESVDCSPSYFHTITSVSSTNHAIDSIVLIYPDVNYDTSRKHFNIYFRHRR